MTLNLLVLSQELDPAGDQRERMQKSMTFHEDIEDHIALEVSPPEPAAFMQLLVDRCQAQAEQLRDAVADERDEELTETVDEYVKDFVANAESVSGKRDEAQFGTDLWPAYTSCTFCDCCKMCLRYT